MANLFNLNFIQKGLLINLISIVLFVFTNIVSATHISEENKPVIYYDYESFVEAYETQQPKNAVLASTLLFVENITHHAAIEFLPTTRLLSQLDTHTDKPACALFKLKTQERLATYYFSLPINFMSTNRLYLRPGMQPLSTELLNEEGELKNITALFDGNQNTILVWRDISYGELVDASLKNIPLKNKVVIQGLSSHGISAKMINRGRADYAIVFPSEVAEFESDTQPVDLLSYRIDGIEPISTGHLMCNKTEASKAWLNKFDNILIELYESPEFLKASIFKINPQEELLVVKAINKIKSDLLKMQ